MGDFTSTPQLWLKAKGRVKLENCFVDGTKIESAAGRRAFARKKAVGTSGRRLDGKSRAYIRMAEDIWEGENRERVEKGLEEPGGRKASPAATRERLPERRGNGLRGWMAKRTGNVKKIEKRAENGWERLFAEKKEA